MKVENFGIDMNHDVVDDDECDDDGVIPRTLDEYASDVDGDVPKKKGSEGANFTVGEDETMVKAWQAVNLDPNTWDEQAGATYWNRIYDHFRRNNISDFHRSQSSVTHRWQTISASCIKWASNLEQVERLNPSGANAQDKVNIAQRLYKGKPKKEAGKEKEVF